jgi:hypothetical protein
VYRSIYPLLQKHAALRGVGASKLVNDILTVWLYNATPRDALRFFNTYHAGPFDADKGPRAKALAAMRRQWKANLDAGRDQWFTANGRRATYNKRAEGVTISSSVQGFTDSAYTIIVNPNTDSYGVDYSLPPFPKDMPPGYLRSIGWQGDMPLSDVAAWLKWAAENTKKMPL